ncbi:MAG: hypothetical protein NUV44_01060 [Candidatus Scalindua sp.]|nr:hypothetical protein [Candidatus Scalindua sp.]
MKRPDPQEKRGLFNSLTHDFSYEWLDDTNKPHTLTIKSHEIGYFPTGQWQFMRRHLADAVINTRSIKTNYEDEYKEVLKEIDVIL